MARQCNNCMNEGYVLGTEDYCKCRFGREKRAKHDYMLQEAKRAIEEAKAFEQSTKQMKKAKSQPNFAVSEGDWTKHGNIIGVVGDFKGEQFLFMASHTYGQVTGDRVTVSKHAWVDAAKYLPAPIELFDNSAQMLIDLALQTGDKEWFDELVKHVKPTTKRGRKK